jgi:hypothetical protein
LKVAIKLELLECLLWTDELGVEQFRTSRGDTTPGETVTHPDDSGEGETNTLRTIDLNPTVPAGMQ